MKKILVLPFLQKQTGHHQVADTIIRSLATRLPNASFQKVDVLSYNYRRIEKLVRNIYFQWIDHCPQIYKHIYERFVYPSTSPAYLKSFEVLLQNTMLRLLSQEQANLIICTQAYPSLILSYLKEQGKVTTPVINIYTDFFVNEVWGRKGINYHFVPDRIVKYDLLTRHGIPDDRIIVTGIPVDESFTSKDKLIKKQSPYHILISGGNGGFGDISDLLRKVADCSEFVFLVLCGNNKRLLKKLISWKLENIKPFPYISSSNEVNNLYDQADAIITKPGGVTISEALQKKLPIFIHSTLPGQEEVNLKHLASQGLVYPLYPDRSIKEQLLSVLSDQSELISLRQRIQEFHQKMETKAWEKILEILNLEKAE